MSRQRDAAPSWHKRPTCPGMWFTIDRTGDGGWLNVSEIDDAAWDSWQSVMKVVRVYGPIPSPPEETEQ